MKLVASLSVERVHDEPGLLWPQGTKRLVVVISDPECCNDVVVAHGIDPTRDDGDGRLVFEVELPRGRLGAFIKAVADCTSTVGAPGQRDIVVADHATGVGDSIINSSPDPRSPTRKAILALAAAIHSDQELAELVARRYSRRWLRNFL